MVVYTRLLVLDSIPTTYLEAASLHAKPWQVTRYIVLPLAWPVLIGGVLYVGIVTMSEITVTDRYQFRSYAEVIYNEFALNPSMDALPLEVASLLVNLSVLVGLGLGLCWLLAARFDSIQTCSGAEILSPSSRIHSMVIGV